MKEFTISNLDDADVAKLMRAFPDGKTQRKSMWLLPVGEAVVTLTITGPSEKEDADILQYAIDVLEVARNHSRSRPMPQASEEAIQPCEQKQP